MTDIQVRTATGHYPIVVERGVASRLAGLLGQRGGRHLVVADRNTAPLVGHDLALALGAAVCELAPGEESKTLESVAELCEAAAREGLERDSTVVAVGGGVVGDMAGFLAAIYLRGVRLIQVPTTLLAQVDSSIGGKTGVNLPAGKNLVGSFKQPDAVYIDPDLLQSLPDREFLSGLAEVAKYGVANDAVLYDLLLRRASELVGRDPQLLMEVIGRCCAIKAGIISSDEHESGVRAILNYGHTFGHGLEAATGYSGFTHGEAVAIGMTVAADIGVAAGVTPPAARGAQKTLLESLGLPTRAPGAAVADSVLEAMSHDKKAVQGEVRWVLLEELGRATPGHQVATEHVAAAVRAALEA